MGNQPNRGLRATAAGDQKARVERSQQVMDYKPTPTGLRFHRSRAMVKGAMGPVGCLPCYTEVMTPDGWIRIADWAGQEILQWDPFLKTPLFKKPQRFINAPCQWGFMAFSIIGGGRMVVTSNHRVVCREPGTDDWNVRRAWELATYTGMADRKCRVEIPGGLDGTERLMISIKFGRVVGADAPDGRQYCFETDTGFFVVRQRENVFVTGNSGKSVFCCEDIFLKSCTQVPMKRIDPRYGMRVRKSRWLVIRNTYWDLQQTTMNTWLDWFPQTVMRKSSPLGGTLTVEHPLNAKLRAEGRDEECTMVQIDLVFLALDREEQVRHLKSFEATGVWINEASEIPWQYVSRAFERTGRYPSKKEGGPFKNLGMIMDTNPPSDTGWWYQLAEVKKPQGYEFFRQPPAVLRREKDGRIWYEPNDGRDPGVPPAENVENHNEGWEYYMRQTRDGDHARIKVFLMGEYGTTLKGKPVYPQYSDEANYVAKELEPYWGLPFFMGTDFGRTPATVILQVLPTGKIVVYDEVCGEEMTIGEFVENLLRPRLITKYRFAEGGRFMNFGDPAGNNPSETDAKGAIYRMNELGIPTVPCPVTGNSPLLRIESVASALRRRMDDGTAGLVITKNCRRLREGFLGRYFYEAALKSDASDERVAAKPKKNQFSHDHDALQYGVFGATHQSGESMFDVSGRGNRLWVPDGFGGYRMNDAAAPRRGSERSLSMAGFY